MTNVQHCTSVAQATNGKVYIYIYGHFVRKWQVRSNILVQNKIMCLILNLFHHFIGTARSLEIHQSPVISMLILIFKKENNSKNKNEIFSHHFGGQKRQRLCKKNYTLCGIPYGNYGSVFISSSQPMYTSMATLMSYSQHLFWLMMAVPFQVFGILNINPASHIHHVSLCSDQFLKVGQRPSL